MRAETLKARREKYPAGTRVVLVKMDDPQAPPVGTAGTVEGVDDIGSLLISWDNGSKLNVLYGEDVVQKMEYQGTESAAEQGRTKHRARTFDYSAVMPREI